MTEVQRIAIDRTRTLLASRLGVRFEIASGEAYREPDGLAGDWIGAFAQPGVILNAATAVRATVADEGGRAIDEYGESTLVVTARKGQRIELRKQYAGKGKLGEFIYVGRLADGMLAGYWYSVVRPRFCGVFWMARIDRLSELSREALDARVRSRSVRRAVVYGLAIAIGVALIAGINGYPAVAGAAVLGYLAARYVFFDRSLAMTREVRLWKRDLG